MARHPHATVITEWARTGKQVQTRGDVSDPWQDVPDNNPAWMPDQLYRIKPEIASCRVFLHKDGRVGVVTNEKEFREIQQSTPINRWLTDWIEYEDD